VHSIKLMAVMVCQLTNCFKSRLNK